MRRYAKIMGCWLLTWFLLSVAIAVFLTGPGGVEVGAIFIVLVLSVCLLGASVHCIVVAVNSRNRKHILYVALPACLLISYVLFSLYEARQCNFQEDVARKRVVEHLIKTDRDPAYLLSATLREKDCVYRYEFSSPSTKRYLYISEWGDVGESTN